MRELNVAYYDRVISKAVMLAMDKKQKNKDLAALLAHLYKAGILTQAHFSRA